MSTLLSTRLCRANEELRVGGSLLGPELDRCRVEPPCRLKRAQRECTVAGFTQRGLAGSSRVARGRRRPRGRARARSSSGARASRRDPRAAQRLDPLCGEPMLLGSSRTRDLPVGHVSDEEVAEGVLTLSPTDGRRSRRTNSFRSSLCRACRPRPVQLADPPQRAQPEHLADDRSILKEQLLLDRQGVEPAGDDSLHGLGSRSSPSSRCRARDRTIRRTPRRREGFRRLARGASSGRLAGRTDARAARARGARSRRRQGRERECRRVRLAPAPARRGE